WSSTTVVRGTSTCTTPTAAPCTSATPRRSDSRLLKLQEKAPGNRGLLLFAALPAGRAGLAASSRPSMLGACTKQQMTATDVARHGPGTGPAAGCIPARPASKATTPE